MPYSNAIDRVLVLSLAGCAIFGAVLLIELSAADTAEPAVIAALALAESRPASRPQGPPVDELAAAALSRPLFVPGRRPAQAKTARSADPGLPQLRLTGIVMEPERHLAIFAAPGAKALVRAEGETVREWRLVSIAPREVSLSGPNGVETLALKSDPDLIRPAAPAASRRDAKPAVAEASPPPVPDAAAARPKRQMIIRAGRPPNPPRPQQ